MAAASPSAALAQPGAAGARAPVTVEVEEDVEVVAKPAGAPAAPQTPPPTAASPATGKPGVAVEVEEDTEVVAQPVGAPPAQPAATQPVAAPAAAVPDASAARIAQLEARLAALEAARAPAQPEAPVADAAPEAPLPSTAPVPPGDLNFTDPWLGVAWSGFVQAEYESNQFSEDQLQPDGQPRNSDRFVVRRARLRMQRNWQYSGMDIEFDANTMRGMTLGMRRLSGSVFWPADEPHKIPYLRGQVGLVDVPFGWDLPGGARDRIFAERTAASLAFFPFESDVGAAVDGGYGPLRYALAVLNGFEADSRFRIRDPNAAKDLLLRVGVDIEHSDTLRIDAGLSFLEGTGFHPGSPATKNTLQWNDINEDGLKTDAEVSGVPGVAAEPSRNFDRWAVGLDARIAVRSPIGWSRLSGELALAQNLDRSLFVADPIASSLDARELGYFVSFTQEITPYIVVGFRTDFYDGNSDFIERRRGRAFTQPQSLRTYSPLIGVTLPRYARLTFQYDFVRDTLGRDSRGEPADLKNNQWTLRLQVGL
ncbi:MAG: hypothetical protein ABW321_12495 [Polyangiales bacterium]